MFSSHLEQIHTVLDKCKTMISTTVIATSSLQGSNLLKGIAFLLQHTFQVLSTTEA